MPQYIIEHNDSSCYDIYFMEYNETKECLRKFVLDITKHFLTWIEVQLSTEKAIPP